MSEEYEESGYYLWRHKNRDDKVYAFPKEELDFDRSVRDESEVEEVVPLYIKKEDMEED